MKLGAWLTGATLMTNVAGADVSLPPLAVPPLFFNVSVTLELPSANGAVV